LKVEKITYEEHFIDLGKQEQKTPEYTKINPFQKVPAIIDNGYILFESNTLMRYLANSKPIADHWYPKDPQQRGYVDLYFDWHAPNIINGIKYLYVKAGSPYFKGVTVEEAKAAADKVWGEFESVFLSQRKFIASDDKLSIADLAVFWHLAGIVDGGYEATPRLREYYDNVLKAAPGLKENQDGYLELRKETFRKQKEEAVKKEEAAKKEAEAKATTA